MSYNGGYMGNPFKSPPFKSPPFSIPLVPVTHKYHQSMTRVEMKPRAWAKAKRNGEQVALRRPHMPFQPERPIQPA